MCEEISKMLKKTFIAARRKASSVVAAAAAADVDNNDHGNITQQNNNERYVLQIMLQSSNIAVASLTQAKHIGPGTNAYWPNYIHPLELAKVDIPTKMPSSAYRKLMESFECMGIYPSSSTTVVDLGACPGGWTSVIRKYFNCRVIAVDRSELDTVLMKDDMVTFVPGDAFTYEPPMHDDDEKEEGGMNRRRKEYWMISDVIAYPERITELLTKWCSKHLASNMIVTMKFQGNEGPDELDVAIRVVQMYGYNCRVKHFFNNKNEVTFMVSEIVEDDTETTRTRRDLEIGRVGKTMYPSI